MTPLAELHTLTNGQHLSGNGHCPTAIERPQNGRNPNGNGFPEHDQAAQAPLKRLDFTLLDQEIQAALQENALRPGNRQKSFKSIRKEVMDKVWEQQIVPLIEAGEDISQIFENPTLTKKAEDSQEIASQKVSKHADYFTRSLSSRLVYFQAREIIDRPDIFGVFGIAYLQKITEIPQSDVNNTTIYSAAFKQRRNILNSAEKLEKTSKHALLEQLSHPILSLLGRQESPQMFQLLQLYQQHLKANEHETPLEREMPKAGDVFWKNFTKRYKDFQEKVAGLLDQHSLEEAFKIAYSEFEPILDYELLALAIRVGHFSPQNLRRHNISPEILAELARLYQSKLRPEPDHSQYQYLLFYGKRSTGAKRFLEVAGPTLETILHNASEYAPRADIDDPMLHAASMYVQTHDQTETQAPPPEATKEDLVKQFLKLSPVTSEILRGENLTPEMLVTLYEIYEDITYPETSPNSPVANKYALNLTPEQNSSFITAFQALHELLHQHSFQLVISPRASMNKNTLLTAAIMFLEGELDRDFEVISAKHQEKIPLTRKVMNRILGQLHRLRARFR